MERRLFYLLNTAQHQLFKFVDSQCEEQLGMSATQAAALMFIAKNEGCLQKELSEALSLNNPAVTGLVSRMMKNSLIVRKSCEHDGRASRLFLSDSGKEKLPKTFPLIHEMNERLTEDFSNEEIDLIVRFLNKVKSTFK